RDVPGLLGEELGGVQADDVLPGLDGNRAIAVGKVLDALIVDMRNGAGLVLNRRTRGGVRVRRRDQQRSHGAKKPYPPAPGSRNWPHPPQRRRATGYGPSPPTARPCATRHRGHRTTSIRPPKPAVVLGSGWTGECRSQVQSHRAS